MLAFGVNERGFGVLYLIGVATFMTFFVSIYINVLPYCHDHRHRERLERATSMSINDRQAVLYDVSAPSGCQYQ